MRYHMKHQFGVRDQAFLQTMHALTGSPLPEGNCVEVLKNGVQIFPSMLTAIKAARLTPSELPRSGVMRTPAGIRPVFHSEPELRRACLRTKEGRHGTKRALIN